MIYIDAIRSQQNRGFTREEFDLNDPERANYPYGAAKSFIPDRFTSLRLNLDIRWDDEHAPLVQKFMVALEELQQAAESIANQTGDRHG